MLMTRSISSRVASSKGLGMAVPALFTRTSSWPKVAAAFSNRSFDRPRISGIRLNRDCLSSAPFNLLHHGSRRLSVLGVSKSHTCAVGCQSLHDRCPNSTRTPSDHCDLARQFLPIVIAHIFRSFFVLCALLPPNLNSIFPSRLDFNECSNASLNCSSGYTCSTAAESDPSATRAPSFW